MGIGDVDTGGIRCISSFRAVYTFHFFTTTFANLSARITSFGNISHTSINLTTPALQHDSNKAIKGRMQVSVSPPQETRKERKAAISFIDGSSFEAINLPYHPQGCGPAKHWGPRCWSRSFVEVNMSAGYDRQATGWLEARMLGGCFGG